MWPEAGNSNDPTNHVPHVCKHQLLRRCEKPGGRANSSESQFSTEPYHKYLIMPTLGKNYDYQATWRRIVAALNSTIRRAKSSNAPNCPAIPARSAPLSITPRRASMAYVRGKM